jgi:ComF family protein
MFKYNARINLAKPLSQLMINFTNNYLKPGKFDIILPVPLHRNRLRERGFNQSELLAKNLARSTNMPIEPKALRRIKPTIAQAGLSRAKRFANLKAAFRVDKSSAVAGKKLLLIDDVFTTGSTLGECAKALLKAKAESVDALVLARGM